MSKASVLRYVISRHEPAGIWHSSPHLDFQFCLPQKWDSSPCVLSWSVQGCHKQSCRLKRSTCRSNNTIPTSLFLWKPQKKRHKLEIDCWMGYDSCINHLLKNHAQTVCTSSCWMAFSRAKLQGNNEERMALCDCDNPNLSWFGDQVKIGHPTPSRYI